MRISLVCAPICAVALAACAPPSPPRVPVADERAAIGATIDDFHDAAAKADDAHPHFEKKKAWSFKAIRRVVTVGEGGAVAWFDEDLATPNLGPARGSGVLVKRGAEWKLGQYNLSITVPNERFDAVKKAAAGDAGP